MSNTIGFAKKRVINKTAVPTMSPSKRAVSQRSLSQPLDAEGRLGLAAGPDSERRTPVNKARQLGMMHMFMKHQKRCVDKVESHKQASFID